MHTEKLIDQEIPFDRGSRLYTRTDRRGVILSSNRMFLDVSGLVADEAIGAAHRIVRHPSMPKGVFHLMWQALQAGEPFAGFLRNRTRDGRFYWVCAIAAPVEGGYVSVASRAAGAQFDLARDLYPRLAEAEAEGASASESAQLLIRGLDAAGHPTLEDFLAEALADHAPEGGPGECPVARMRALRSDLARLSDAQAELLATLQKLYLIPTNMRILASRLEPSGGPVSAISDSYKRAASELMARLHRAGGDGKSGSGAAAAQAHAPARASQTGEGSALMSRALFMRSAAAIVARAAAQFRDDPSVSLPERACEMDSLHQLAAEFARGAHESATAVALNVARIGKEAENIKRLMAGLDQIRILGEVESGRIRHADGGLASIMAQLTSFHGLIHTRLSAMSNAAARMRIEAV